MSPGGACSLPQGPRPSGRPWQPAPHREEPQVPAGSLRGSTFYLPRPHPATPAGEQQGHVAEAHPTRQGRSALDAVLLGGRRFLRE